jgi:2-polyprenyl-3-methyl-5-hydroxy-6-metoxy-1,4-benzoquinol methylase
MNSSIIRREKCPVCSCLNPDILYRKKYHDKLIFRYMEIAYQGYADLDFLEDVDFELVKCRKCSFIYQTNVLNDEKLADLYNKWIHPELAMDWNNMELFNKQVTNFQIIRFIAGYFNKDVSTIKILDYGAGFGDFLKLAENCGMKTRALEFSSERVDSLKKKGISVISPEVSRTEKFDFILVSSVLEHLTDPVSFLAEISSLLHNDSIAFIDVPNCRNIETKIKKCLAITDPGELHKAFLSANISAFQHVNFFNHSNFKSLLKSSGFEIIFKPFLEFSTSNNSNKIIVPMLKPFYNHFFNTAFYIKKGA